ncbi:hypothetical protein N7492_002046 [Penicillium capsulatum]|uniref:SGNH hydrolase-type esterase domain-containing protein n=1 Tax=Penicillium capsulatum TaxID=69766 RepID=A0A9W9IKP4_9EURO|nr:hypothetical protein N7492_002046 [Penicillium capsulatum]KAJ6123334.1 hypothetical protein N7512_005799 [Penicillium capsulatum]
MGVLWQLAIASLGISTSLAASVPTNTSHGVENKDPMPQTWSKRADSKTDDFDPWDLSHITKIAAIGDSYSAGIGAGDRLGNNYDPTKMGAWACSRYDKAYPNLVNENSAFGDSSKRKFQFESCSGALTKDVTDDQVKRLDDGQHAIMLSAGGNDAGLVDILNQCVYQIFAPTKEAAALMETSPAFKAIEWFKDADLHKYTRGCDGTLEDSKKLIEGGEFSKNLDSLLSKTKEKLAKDGKIYYTGYAHFWSDSMSDGDSCSKKTWSVYNQGGGKYALQPAVKLTVDRRKKMNELVDAVNKKIAEAVKRAGDQVVFVDYELDVRTSGGQFCEKGVDEPNPDRKGLMFYELEISDPLGMSPFKRDGDDAFEGTFEYDLNRLAELTLTAGSTFKDTSHAKNSTETKKNKEGKRFVDAVLPDGYKRIFHPTIKAHKSIADYLVYYMVIANGEKHHTDASSSTSSGRCSELKPTESEPTKPKCDLDMLSGVSYKVFNGVYDKFCKQVDKNQKEEKDDGLAWMVDAHGDKIPNRKRGFLEGRTPPPNPDSYKGFNFGLVWDRKSDKGKGKCATSCKSAFDKITLACGHTGGEQNGMARDASVSTACGKFSYKISGSRMPKLEDPRHVERKCNDPKDLKGKDPGPVSSDQQAEETNTFCDMTKGKKLRAHDDPIKYELFDGNTGTWYYYIVGWTTGCQSSVKEVDVEFPLGKDDKNNCRSLMRWTYKLCGDNGGLGGYYEVGCLKYAFVGA